VSDFSEDEAADYRNLNIGFVFQEHLLLPFLTVSENVTLPLMASKSSLKDLSAKEQHIKLLMESTGIYNLRDKYPFTISGGEAQRGALVRALANSPSILPSSGLIVYCILTYENLSN